MRISVRLTPNASRDEIGARMADGTWKIKVQSPPVEGKANRRLIRYLAKRLNVSKSAVRIVSGERTRTKILEIDGNATDITRRMEEGL